MLDGTKYYYCCNLHLVAYFKSRNIEHYQMFTNLDGVTFFIYQRDARVINAIVDFFRFEELQEVVKGYNIAKQEIEDRI